MTSDQEVTQEQYEELLEDAKYLQDEAEALMYIIDEVPYTEAPSDGMSIIQMLALIDHAQKNYYRPLIEKSFSNPRSLQLNNFESYDETFEFPEDEKDVQKILRKISKHRAAVLNLFEKIPLIDWEREVKSGHQSIRLFDFANKMVRDERKILKEIADLVLIYQNNKQANRQVDAKARQRHNIEE
ncbi:hypothetical protein [Rhodohalobacter sp. 8-1]|uniref:hypothetical protein n=1 Tax=Rhodohalobacter sp. 8-1 TaxID=3131972 RepID=UPI0030ED3E52